jgi:DNA-binding IclR family transcriptional regulator
MKQELHRLKQKADQDTAYKSISRAADILSCLSDGNNSVTDIARVCKLSKPTVSRLLKSLEKSSFVTRDPFRRKYYLGSLLTRLMVNPKTTHLNLITISTEEMSRLWEICGETIALGTLVGIQNIRLHLVLGKHNVRVYDDDVANLASPQIYGAPAKALLAQLGQKELELVLNNIQDDVSGKPVVDRQEFIRQLTQIRKQGYTVTRGEKIVGALAISALINGYQFPVALTVAGIESRLAPKVPELIPEILASATRISQTLSTFA